MLFRSHQLLPNENRHYRDLGTGFVYSSNGLIITHHSNIKNANKLVVELSDGRVYNAKIIGADDELSYLLAMSQLIGNVQDTVSRGFNSPGCGLPHSNGLFNVVASTLTGSTVLDPVDFSS